MLMFCITCWKAKEIDFIISLIFIYVKKSDFYVHKDVVIDQLLIREKIRIYGDLFQIVKLPGENRIYIFIFF